MRTLHELPKFSDRWSYLYLERGRLEKEATGLVFHSADAHTSIPIDQLSLVMLGPGSSLTHAAVTALAANNCLLAWVGENGVRTYAHSTGGTFSARRLLRQARLCSDEAQRLAVVYRMYQKRFPGEPLEGKSIEQVRGMEGLRVRKAYEELAKEHGIAWEGRTYDQDNWFHATAANRALSAANACLYGICHAAIVSAGYSAALGFIHTGKMLSFVYDVADFYKTEVTVPVAFRLVATVTKDLEREVRQECRKAFHAFRLMARILPDVAEVLDAGDDLGETPAELEGALSRWLIELRPGIFLGNPSQRVRDELWKRVTKRPPLGYVAQIWSSPTPQGYNYRQFGESKRWLQDFDGLALVTIVKHSAQERRGGARPDQNPL